MPGLRAAQAGTSEAEVSLNDTAVVAPFDGDVVKKSVELGSFASSGSPAFAVAKTDVVKIVIGGRNGVTTLLPHGKRK
jgi:multidrug resistance efflux pump